MDNQQSLDELRASHNARIAGVATSQRPGGGFCATLQEEVQARLDQALASNAAQSEINQLRQLQRKFRRKQCEIDVRAVWEALSTDRQRVVIDALMIAADIGGGPTAVTFRP